MPADERLAALRRIEQRLEEIRGLLGADAREQQYRTFSLPQMIGSVLQALVVGVLFAALSDWIFEAPLGSQLVKLAFAGVLQLGALTALVSDRKRP